MDVFITSKDEEDPIKIEGDRVATTQWQLTPQSEVRGRTHPRFYSCPCYLVTCKNEEDPLKNKDARVATTENINFQTLKGR